MCFLLQKVFIVSLRFSITARVVHFLMRLLHFTEVFIQRLLQAPGAGSRTTSCLLGKGLGLWNHSKPATTQNLAVLLRPSPLEQPQHLFVLLKDGRTQLRQFLTQLPTHFRAVVTLFR